MNNQKASHERRQIQSIAIIVVTVAVAVAMSVFHLQSAILSHLSRVFR